MRSDDSRPVTCGVAFKEWAGVCEALAEGRQSIIVRKGGIAEGPGGFVPEQDRFWLYPTRVHEREQGLRLPPPRDQDLPPKTVPGVVEVGTLVEVDPIWWVDRLEALAELGVFHVWTEETIQKRFLYRRPGLWVLGVRVFRREEPWLIPVTSEHAGCKTWVPLDPPLGTVGVAPVLVDQEHHRVMDRIRSTMNAAR